MRAWQLKQKRPSLWPWHGAGHCLLGSWILNPTRILASPCCIFLDTFASTQVRRSINQGVHHGFNKDYWQTHEGRKQNEAGIHFEIPILQYENINETELKAHFDSKSNHSQNVEIKHTSWSSQNSKFDGIQHGSAETMMILPCFWEFCFWKVILRKFQKSMVLYYYRHVYAARHSRHFLYKDELGLGFLEEWKASWPIYVGSFCPSCSHACKYLRWTTITLLYLNFNTICIISLLN